MNLSFRIGKIPVQVLPSFFITTVMLSLGRTSLSELVVWTVIVLSSVLAHELGHAAVARACGLEPNIQLYGMGGLTGWRSSRPLSVTQRISISLAGPFAGFVIAAVVLWVLPPVWFQSALGTVVRDDLLFVNFVWGAFNLLPMLPLDGGDVMAQLLRAVTRGHGEKTARVVSIAVAASVALFAGVYKHWWYGAALAAYFAFANGRALKDLAAAEHDAPMRATLKQAHAALEAKSAARLVELVRPVALHSRTAPVRAEALQLLAFGFLLEGRVADADAAIAALPQGFEAARSLLELRARVAGSPAAQG